MSAQALMEQPATTVGLSDLAAEINSEHGLVRDAAQAALHHAIRAGEALVRARALVPEGEWEEWVRINCDISITTSKHYIRVASYAELLVGKDISGPQAALAYLRGLPAVNGTRVGHGYPESLKEEARRLAKTLSQREVARVMGLPRNTVRNWIQPREKKEGAAKRRAAAQRRAAREQKSAAIGDAARTAGGEVARAYGGTRQAVQALERAVEGESSLEVRRELRRAQTSLYGAEDAIGAAIRLQGVVR